MDPADGDGTTGRRALPRTLPVRVITVIIIGVVAATLAVRLTQTSPRNDFTQDYVAARAMFDGGNPYERTEVLAHRYLGARAKFYEEASDLRDPHPPALILLIAPLSFLPYAAAWTIWKIIIVAGIAFSIFLICRALGVARADSLMIGIGSLIIPSVQQELLYGGTTVVVMVLLAVCFWAFARPSGPVMGLTAGAATALKLFPGLLAIWLLKLRRFSDVAWMMVGTVAAVAASIGVAGLQNARDFFSASHVNFEQFKDSPINMSLPAMAFRITGGGTATAIAVVIGLFGLTIAIRSQGNLSGAFWSAVPWMILLSPLAWYAVLMAPVVVVAIVRLTQKGQLRWWHLLLFAAGSFGTVSSIGRNATGAGSVALDLIPTLAVLVFALLDAFPTRARVVENLTL